MSCEREMAAVLRGAGQKVTPQRMLILCSVHHAEGHITASQILAEVRRSQPYIHASTVYRTLASAKELRLVSETKMGGGDNTFEWLGADRHHHLICRVCGEGGTLEAAHLSRFAPAASSRLTQVCLRSWKRTAPRPAASAIFLNAFVMRRRPGRRRWRLGRR